MEGVLSPIPGIEVTRGQRVREEFRLVQEVQRLQEASNVTGGLLGLEESCLLLQVERLPEAQKESCILLRVDRLTEAF